MARGQTPVIISRGLVLDANILIRAALGKRVRFLLENYEDSLSFYTPDVCFADAREYVPQLLVPTVDESLYRDFEQLARERMAARDIDDWPVVAVALMLKIPVWTEGRDFSARA